MGGQIFNIFNLRWWSCDVGFCVFSPFSQVFHHIVRSSFIVNSKCLWPKTIWFPWFLPTNNLENLSWWEKPSKKRPWRIYAIAALRSKEVCQVHLSNLWERRYDIVRAAEDGFSWQQVGLREMVPCICHMLWDCNGFKMQREKRGERDRGHVCIYMYMHVWRLMAVCVTCTWIKGEHVSSFFHIFPSKLISPKRIPSVFLHSPGGESDHGRAQLRWYRHRRWSHRVVEIFPRYIWHHLTWQKEKHQKRKTWSTPKMVESHGKPLFSIYHHFWLTWF